MAMIEDGDRTCPLCTEEMDLTDQQLKPCKCGYDICVWCWHQIMEMAEKEGSEGRCPACRNIYDKQKIIATDNCKRMVTEEKKQKSQRTKNKPLSTIEDRKQLSNVRVVQRNLAYIMGMPSNLADETILERKEYFGQYGKVLKVSISRQAGTTVPQASINDTFNVYITYAREEEAIRCIQYVHNFVLEDRPLRACFGTTKYCYIWLRNMVCNNPDCVYLHDIGSQEDSFTKDEIISAYTRSRVPQIPSNCLQLRAGDVLPPPAEDFHNNNTTTAKPPTKNSYNITVNQPKSSHVDTSSTSSTVLPSATSWASRVSNFRSPTSSTANLQNSITQKLEILRGTSNSPMNTSTKQKSVWHEDRSRVSEPLKNYNVSNSNSRVQDVEYNSTSAWEDDMPSESISYRNQTVHANGKYKNTPSKSDSPEENSLKESRHSAWDDDIILNSNTDGEIKNVANSDRFRSLENDTKDPVPCDLSSSLDELNLANLPGDSSSSLDELNHVNLPCDLSSSFDELNHVDLPVTENKESLYLYSDTRPGSNHIEMSQQKCMDISHHLAENFENLNLSLRQYRENEVECLASLPEIDAPMIHEEHVLSPLISFNHLTTSHKRESADKLVSVGETSGTWDSSRNEPLYVNGISESNIYTKNSLYLSDFDNNSYIDKYSNANREDKSTVSNVLSSDFDPWDNSWSSANNFAELLAQMNNKHDAPSKQSSSLMVHDANQSRFSFARQDNYQPNIGYGEKIAYSNQEAYGNIGNPLPSSNFERANMFGNNGISSDATSGITRRKISPPPGFTLPNTRAPPPGFSSPDRYDQALNTFSDVRLLNSPLQNQFQIHPANNTADVEFIDPAILAVGKGRLPLGSNNVTGLSSRSSIFNPNFNTKDNDARIQLLMQQSIYSNHPSRSQNNIQEDRFLQRGDTYSNSRHSMQNPSISSYSHISHQQPLYNQSSQWNGWSDTQMNNGMDERFRLNSYFQSNEESKLHISNSGDFYNRTYGI